MTSLEQVIEEYRQVVEGKIVEAEAAKKKLDLLVELRKIKGRRLKGENLTEDDVFQAMKLLCWGSFAGCCSPAKGCPWNNAVSDALGIDYKELYESKKKLMDEELEKLMEGRMKGGVGG